MASDKSGVLRVGPVPLNERIDPSDPDEVGGIASATGGGYDSMAIIEANAAVYAKIGPALSLSPDLRASEYLDREEVQEVAGVPIEGASVRGVDGSEKVVVYITRSESGRSSKGVLPYSDLPKSQAAFKDALKREQESIEAARAAAGVVAAPSGGNPRVSELEQEVARLRDRLNEAEKAAEAAPTPSSSSSEEEPAQKAPAKRKAPARRKAPAKRAASKTSK